MKIRFKEKRKKKIVFTGDLFLRFYCILTRHNSIDWS